MHPDSPMMTCKEAARVSGVSADYVRKMLNDGLLEGKKNRPMRVSVSSFCELYGLEADKVYQLLAKWRNQKLRKAVPSPLYVSGQESLIPEPAIGPRCVIDEKAGSPIARQLKRKIDAKVKAGIYE